METEALKGNKMNIENKIKELTSEVYYLNKIEYTNRFYKSLIASIRCAGGSTDWVTEETTIKELADILAVNGVRFIYDREESL